MRIFKKNKKDFKSLSLNAITWKSFKHDKLGMFSLIFIVFIFIIATLGYLISPDNSPYSNRQLLEISLSKPGTTFKMLKVKRNNNIEKKSFLNILISGKPEEYDFYPIENYYFKSDSVGIELIKAETPFNTKDFNIADVLFSIDNNKQIVRADNKLNFSTIDGKKHYEDINKLQKRIEEEAIENKTFLLGTDRYGRDVLSQLIIGSRVSFSVGLISVSIALIIGTFLGAIAGYYRGWVDELLMWFINVVWSIPSLLLVIAISFALGKGFWQVFIAIGLTMWVDVARVVRGQVLSIREKEFVEAGKALGYSNFRIIFKHILPNVTGTISVIAASNFASAILIESGLSFLGLGVQPPMPSWGTMIKENYGYIILDYAYLAIIPGIAIMLLVLAFMLLGNALRDALDVKS